MTSMKLSAQPLVNAVAVPRLLLKELGIKVSDRSLKVKLEGHVDFPSLMAVSDCFNEWRIPNLAIHIPKEKYNAEKLSHLLLSHLSKENNDEELVKNLFTNETENIKITVASRYEATAVYSIGEKIIANTKQQLALF